MLAIFEKYFIFDNHCYFSGKKMSPDVKSIVYCTAVRNTNESVWDSVWDEYMTTTNNLDQTIFLSALGCSKNETILTT